MFLGLVPLIFFWRGSLFLAYLALNLCGHVFVHTKMQNNR
jgi:hypothetical protein